MIGTLVTLGAAGVVAYLPGALIFRLPIGQRDRRAAFAAEERTFWAVMLSLAWSLAIVIGLAVLGRYTFGRLLATNALVSTVLLVAGRGALFYRGTAPRWTAAALIPAAIVALGASLYFPPSEYVIGGKDPGTYINEGIQIAQRGALTVRDPVIASVPAPYRDLFFPSYKLPIYYSLRFMGFFIQNPDDGAVIGQFPQLYPASIAIGYGLNGLSGARQTVGVWAILGLVAVYFTGARIFGRAAAAAAVTLLAVHVTQVWFARYPNSELTMQALLFAALLAFARATEGSQGFFGVVAGSFLGLMLFLRYEVLLAIFACCLAGVIAPATRQKIGRSFVVTLTITGLAGLWYLEVPMRAYSELPLRFTRDSGGWWVAGGALVAAWLVRRTYVWPAWLAIVRRAVPIGLGVTLVVLATYAYFFRQVGPGLGPHDAASFRTFAWYVAPPILAISVAAVAIMSAATFWRDPAFFLTFAAFSVFFFYKTRIQPEQFWAARRFLVVPLPGLFLLLAACVDQAVGYTGVSRIAARLEGGGHDGTGHRMLKSTPGVLGAGVVGAGGCVLLALALSPVAISFWNATRPVLHHVEYAGIIPHLEHLAASIGDRDLLIVESRNAGSDLHVLAVPLAYIYARNVLLLSSPVPPKRVLDEFITWAGTKYARVLFLGGGGTDLLTRHLTAEPVGGDRFQVPEYDAPQNAYPSGSRQKEFEYGLYQLVATERAAAGPIDLQIGKLDDLNVIRFHAKEETSDHVIFRWSQGQSFILLVGVAPTARTLTVWMGNGGRPPQAPPATVEFALDDQVLGSATPDDAIRPYTFALPPEAVARASATQDPVRLRLRVATWRPSDILHVTDTRALGVMVSRVEVR